MKKRLNIIFATAIFISSCSDLEKKEVSITNIDCSSMAPVTESYWKGIQSWNYGEWEIRSNGKVGSCWGSAGDSRSGYLYFRTNYTDIGYLRYWVTIPPDEVLINWTKMIPKEIERHSGWTQYQIGPCDLGSNIVSLTWVYGPSNNQFLIDEIEQIW